VFESGDLRVEAVPPAAQLRFIRFGKGRVERRQAFAFLDDLPGADVDRLDDRRVERLDHDVRQRGDQTSAGGDDQVGFGQACPGQENEDGHGQHMQCDPGLAGKRPALDFVCVGQEIEGGLCLLRLFSVEDHRWLVCWFQSC